MKIALINDTSQSSKNSIIFSALSKVANMYDHIVVNYGSFGADDAHQMTYVQAGVLAAILLNSGAVDFVVTGCGTGEGAMLVANSFPNVLCGHITEPADAFMFRQINNGNAVSLPYAKGFGWGAELNLEYTFEKLLSCEGGNGYPLERAVPEKQNKLVLDELKKVTHKDMLTILKTMDQKLLKDTIDYRFFKVNFFADCKDQKIAEYLQSVLNKK